MCQRPRSDDNHDDSTGGRPSLEGTDRRQKIPTSDADWKRFEEIAERLTDAELRPSAGQVAGVLLHESLAHFDEEALRADLLEKQRAPCRLEENRLYFPWSAMVLIFSPI